MSSEPILDFQKAAEESLKSQVLGSTKVVILNGYIGGIYNVYSDETLKPIADGPDWKVHYKFVKIYPLLNHSAYFKVRLSDIKFSEPATPGLLSGPSRVTVNATADIEFVQKLKTDDNFLEGSISATYLAGTIRISSSLRLLTASPPTKNGDPTCEPLCTMNGTPCQNPPQTTNCGP